MKQFFLLIFIGWTSSFFSQAPDGNPSTFTSIGNGSWNSTGTWNLDSGFDTDGIPDGDDYVLVDNHSVTLLQMLALDI